ncbi:hypothetical protein DEIPH_ctg006orf0015 [Deinococcus phoenicis]|uniref:Uncharacterized protein n=1 Tax=Deinococcus phoenicis TaxID=1476583 RepID=A0A016QTK8_9DEIO|nr:hypothetical protein [Deinococcus phoenicis]EYB69450.1 hypothetical protein DEIPH_ctg006orf0015 [Deinococcus phoenicis]
MSAVPVNEAAPTPAPAVTFSGPQRVPYPGGCVLEPGPYALDYLLKWRTAVTVRGTVHPNTPVFAFLRDLLSDPAAYDLTPADAQAARDRFLELAGQALSAEGGDPAWLAREFNR